jgi:hypothetical protein
MLLNLQAADRDPAVFADADVVRRDAAFGAPPGVRHRGALLPGAALDWAHSRLSNIILDSLRGCSPMSRHDPDA